VHHTPQRARLERLQSAFVRAAPAPPEGATP